AQFRDAFYSLRTVNNPDPHSFPTRRSSDLIMWGGQEALDYRAEGGGRSIIDKRVDFFRRGWQSRQIERGAADESDLVGGRGGLEDRKSTRLNSSHLGISYAVFCLKKKNKII